jgi:serine/threonine protein kinase
MLTCFSNPTFRHSERPQELRLFENEARKLLALKHPQIPALRAFFHDQTLNRHVMVMECVHGQDLDAIVGSQGTLTAQETLYIVSHQFQFIFLF